MGENIFTAKEIGSILQKTEKNIKHLFRTKRLSYFRDNGRIRVRESDLDNFFYLTGQKPLREQMAANS